MDGELLREVARLHSRLQRLKVSSCGPRKTAECQVLTEVWRAGESSIADLTRALGLDKAWLSRTAKQLVQGGFLQKKKSKADGRLILFRLTSKGRERTEALNKNLNAISDAVVSRLDDDQRKKLRGLLEAIEDSLKAELALCAERKPS